MSYWENKGKYQKANDFLFKKLVPSYGSSGSNLGEALCLVTRVYYRHYNDGINTVTVFTSKWFHNLTMVNFHLMENTNH